MSPAQFLARLKKGDVPPVCLFLGSEAFQRRRCRQALLESQSDAEVTQYDAGETALAEIVDDARALSLFASRRLISVIAAEAALPRTGDEESTAPDDVLTNYVKDPSPGVVLLLEAARFDLEGEDRKKSDRVRKFYAAVPDVVEFPRMSPDDARIELQAMARRLNVRLDAAAAAMLVDSLAADVTRIATELEKISLFAGPERTITADDIIELVPDARASTIFNLVNALGRGDRARSLSQLDVLCREGEYLPLALAFLSTQFRQALVARKAGLRTPQQVQSYFQKAGAAMWGRQAEQVAQTARRFSSGQLESGLKLIFEADRDLRSARPDDRIVMEQFVVRLTA
jgi:DNA polymerase-3 subunit delta